MEKSIPFFKKAIPVWPAGLEKEKNILIGFKCVFIAKSISSVFTLKITAHSTYRIWTNGNMTGWGPARAAHGYARVDEWQLNKYIKAGRNIVAIEVASYNINSYSMPANPPFLQAELSEDDHVFAATNIQNNDFRPEKLEYRIQKCIRYSFQRPFAEAYNLNPSSERWRYSPLPVGEQIKELSMVSGISLLPRRVPLPSLNKTAPYKWISAGKAIFTDLPEKTWRPNFIYEVGDKIKGFKESELEANPIADLEKITFKNTSQINEIFNGNSDITLPKQTYRIVDFGQELTGFPGVQVSCNEPTSFYFIFDEILVENEINFKRLTCANTIKFHLEPGSYLLEAMEPYSLRYLQCLALHGDCTIRGLYLRELSSSHVYLSHFSCSNPQINKIFEAARNTFRQNALDIFMDCPSRERAGWLGDSFFAARVENDLTGRHEIEKNFLENFLLANSYGKVPEGMIPMCYPSDHIDGNFIPNWPMWLVLQLEEYLTRTNDSRLIKGMQPKIRKFISYFQKFRNEIGLLEKLDGWIFIEWSKANEFVQDVNFPTNMLFAAMLDSAGKLYQDVHLRKDASALRQTIRKIAFDGEFFVDNAVRKEGKLVLTSNRTETCQYFAFFFDIATPSDFPALWNKIVHEFGPHRIKTGLHPQIHPANSFMGNYLRMEILSRYHQQEKIFQEIIPYFLHMAETTGTLWENADACASCNHGFASHVARVIYRDILGCKIDPSSKTILLDIPNVPLSWCEGRIPMGDNQFVIARWEKTEKGIDYFLSGPAEYQKVIKYERNK